MELEMHSLNAMRNMEVIDISTGGKLGFVKDFKVDCEENKITSLILPGSTKSWFGKEEEKEIMWNDIVRIGVDVILVDTGERMNQNLNNV
ncbi:YlmC/YmxH family sporulation protein [Clostridium weizhouense]|uniref:YlmC/YmxH family sporulation protein n=1 Tax=Clostridium weizhouense TaxID=2859781 RepID=A0ABS7AQN8_9CLOT|nr:YlmC/YmxH family sporulation protein [Clostridium weizhouense]MBW6409815.1 YlmC/YmxH family sporulation protein [Clostridium weizhouense]